MKHQQSAHESAVFYNITFIITLAFLLLPGSLWAQDELNVIRGESSNNSWLHYSDARNALYHHLAGQAYELLEQRAEFVSGLQSLDDWQQRQQEVRKTLMEIMGPFPEKTPLNAEVVRTIDKDGYTVEHIVFESQPQFYVTSSLFIPDDVEDRGPAILYLSGHTQDGYRAGTYQHKIINLVKKGFIVFAVDPVGQGERLEYFDPDAGGSVVGGPTREHSYSGVQAFLTGSSQARYMTWDGIRAVDYLLTRNEIDPDRIGVTGRSGGGTQSAYVAAMDERIYAAAPEAYITNFTRLLQSIGPQDAEQNLFHGIARGIDHADFLAVRAPKPTLVIATTEDFFSIQGARETAEEVSALYKAYGMEDHFGIVEDGGGHGSTQKNREAMYAFFQKHLDNPGNADDEDVGILNDEEIRVTGTGQVSTSLGGETVFSLNRREAEQQLNDVQTSRNNSGSHFPGVLSAAKELSGYQSPEEVEQPVFAGRIQREGYVIEKYFVQGEGNYVIPYLLMIPEITNGKALIYLHPAGKAAEASADGEMEWFVRNGFTVLAPDMIGVGELGPGDVSNYATQVKDFDGTSFDVWTASVLIGRSITGIQAGDVVRLTRLLENHLNTDEVLGVARQQMAPVLLHAAAFEPSITRIALVEPYSSYREIVRKRFYDPGFHLSTVAGAIGVYDLPDLAASLAPRKLLMAGVTDGAGYHSDHEDVNKDMSVIREAYERVNQYDQLMISTGDVSGNLYELFREWLE